MALATSVYNLRLSTILTAISVLTAMAGMAQPVSSVQDGDWNNSATWDCNCVPDFTRGTITISSNTIVTVPSGFTADADQMVVQANAQLIISGGGSLVVRDGSGVDLQINSGGVVTVNGILENRGDISLNNINNLIVNGKFLHNRNGGLIPQATWNTGSTLEITGITRTVPSGLNQAFYNFIWNAPSQTSDIYFNGNLTQVTNDFVVRKTGNVRSVILQSSGTGTLTVGRDLIIENDANLRILQSGNFTVNINRNLEISSIGSSPMIFQNSGSAVVNVQGDFVKTNVGRIIFCASSSQSTGILNVGGDFVFTGGSITELSDHPLSSGIINFNGSGVQNFTGGGRFSNNIDFAVASTSVLDLKTFSLTGPGNFTLNGTLRVGSTDPNGPIQNNITRGNIRVEGTRTYNPGCTIELNGVGPQAIGSDHPTGSGITQVFNNPSGVTLKNNITIDGNVILQAGNLNLGNFNINMNGPSWLANGGNLTFGTGTLTFGSTTNVGGTSIPSFGNVVVSSSGAVTLTNHANVLGNLTLQAGGTLNTSSFELRLTGNSNQNISANGGSLNRVVINKTGGAVNLTSPLFLTGTLQFISETNLITNGNLTLRSTNDQPAADGNIAALPAGALITGNVTVERYFQAIDDVDRFISSPISNATVAQLQDDFPVTGNFTGTSYPCTGCRNNGASLRRYVETKINLPLKQRYVAVPAPGGSNTEVLVPGVGYDAWMWNGVAPTVWDVTGTINRGPINFTISHTPSTPPMPTVDGWNLVGNPYPSAIQWNNGPGWSRTNVDPTVWVWDVVGQVWRSYNYNTGTGNLTDGIIALGQAFWVYVPNPGPASMSINEAAKSTVGSGSYYRTTDSPVVPFVKIRIEGDGAVNDEAYIVLHPEATPNYDVGIDAMKLYTGQERLSFGFQVKDKVYGSYGISSLEEQVFLPLHILAEEGLYKVSLTSHGLNKTFYLVDKLTERVVELNRAYVLDGRQGSLNGRFIITDNPQLVLREVARPKVEVFPNPATDYIHVLNVPDVLSVQVISVNGVVQPVGKPIHQDNQLTMDIKALNPGTYILWIHTSSGTFVQKFMVNKP
jgi:hypothetical protein